MKAEIKKRWVDALRSGQYVQARGQLRDGGAFCCLGVLCDLVKDETGSRWIGGSIFKADGPHDDWEQYVVPPSLVKYTGLVDGEGSFGGASLAALNDSGALFDELADLIERHL